MEQLNEEMELFINQIKQLNQQFQDCIKCNKRFEESKIIYSKIKEANAKFSAYLNSRSHADLVKDRQETSNA